MPTAIGLECWLSDPVQKNLPLPFSATHVQMWLCFSCRHVQPTCVASSHILLPCIALLRVWGAATPDYHANCSFLLYCLLFAAGRLG